MESEKRALINFHSQPDWRVAIFESNRRRQLDGSNTLNKARGLLWRLPSVLGDTLPAWFSLTAAGSRSEQSSLSSRATTPGLPVRGEAGDRAGWAARLRAQAFRAATNEVSSDDGSFASAAAAASGAGCCWRRVAPRSRVGIRRGHCSRKAE